MISDSCYDFLEAVAAAARRFAEDVHHYSDPDYPLHYGPEVDGLRHACAAVAAAPYNPEPAALLLRLAASTAVFLNAEPGDPALPILRADVTRLTALLQADLDTRDAASVPAIVQNLVNETPATARAVTRLQAILPKLGKATYDTAVKIITDIGSATAKDMLGL